MRKISKRHFYSCEVFATKLFPQSSSEGVPIKVLGIFITLTKVIENLDFTLQSMANSIIVVVNSKVDHYNYLFNGVEDQHTFPISTIFCYKLTSHKARQVTSTAGMLPTNTTYNARHYPWPSRILLYFNWRFAHASRPGIITFRLVALYGSLWHGCSQFPASDHSHSK